MNRKQEAAIVKDLAKKMVFLVGPRQVGKTWLSKNIARDYQNSVYLSYDSIEDREIIQKKLWREQTDLLILDELHKMREWKNYLKGLYDTKPNHLKIIVTGSARLETFRQAGDALTGRFFRHRLLPFSLAELQQTQQNTDFGLSLLIERGGFPEALLSENNTETNRWRQQYVDGLVRTDVLDFEKIQDLRAMQLTLDLLRRRVGSPVSYTSIAEDVGVSSHTVKKFIEILQSLYIVFRVHPYSKNIARSILKEPKIYFYDNGMVIGGEGVKLENFVAVSLLKHVYAQNDYLGKSYELKYLRTKDGKEVDFCLVNEQKIEELIEVKVSEKNIDSSLRYFCKTYDQKGIQVVQELGQEYTLDKIEVRRAEQYLRELYL